MTGGGIFGCYSISKIVYFNQKAKYQRLKFDFLSLKIINQDFYKTKIYQSYIENYTSRFLYIKTNDFRTVFYFYKRTAIFIKLTEQSFLGRQTNGSHELDAISKP